MLKKVFSYLLVIVMFLSVIGRVPVYASEVSDAFISSENIEIIDSAKLYDAPSTYYENIEEYNLGEYCTITKDMYKEDGGLCNYCFSFVADETGYYDCCFKNGSKDELVNIYLEDRTSDKMVYCDNFGMETYFGKNNCNSKNAYVLIKGHKYLGTINYHGKKNFLENASFIIKKNNDIRSNIVLGDNMYKEKNCSKVVYNFKPEKTMIYSFKNKSSNNVIQAIEILNKNDPEEYVLIDEECSFDGEFDFELKEGNEYYIRIYALNGTEKSLDYYVLISNFFSGENTQNIDNNCEIKFEVTPKEVIDYKVEKDFDTYNTFEDFENKKFKATVTYKDGSKKVVSNCLYEKDYYALRIPATNYNADSLIDNVKAGKHTIVFSYFSHNCSLEINVTKGYDYAIKHGKSINILEPIKKSGSEGIKDEYYYFTPKQTGMYDIFVEDKEKQEYVQLSGLDVELLLENRGFYIRDSNDNIVPHKKDEGYVFKKGRKYALCIGMHYNIIFSWDFKFDLSKTHKHTVVVDKAAKPTTTKTGLTQGSHCSECGKIIVEQKVVPKKVVIKLNKTKLTLKKGKSATLKISGTKAKVTWKTGNKKIAKVNSKGKVTAVKKGKVNIFATVGGKVYKCLVICK